MSDEFCWCISCANGDFCFEGRRKNLKALVTNVYEQRREIESLKKTIEEIRKGKEESSEIYIKRNLVLHEENQKLHKEVEKLKEEYESLKEQNDSLRQAIHAEQEKYKDVCRMNVLLNDQVNHKEHIIKELRKTNGELAGAAIKKEEPISEPKFKVGDRFSDILGDFENGKVKASFRKIGGDSRNEFLYEVEHEGCCPVDGEFCVFSENQMQETVPTEDLKVGDKVKVEFEGEISGLTDGWTGRNCYIVETGESLFPTMTIVKKYVKKIEG